MSKPDDIPQDVWGLVRDLLAEEGLPSVVEDYSDGTSYLIPVTLIAHAILAERRRALSEIDTLTESRQEGLMTDADLTEADRAAMRHQLTALAVAAAAIRTTGA